MERRDRRARRLGVWATWLTAAALVTPGANIRLASSDAPAVDRGEAPAAAQRGAGVSVSKEPSLAGQWRGRLTVGEGRTTELVVDLGIVANRWAGQFDLHDFGVEDYPVDVTLDGRDVALHLSAAQIDFEGTLSTAGDVLAGIASTRGERDSLVLRRGGEAQFSAEFLTLEMAAEDSTRVELLSSDGAALRRRFNDDRPYTRLVMLLSPS